MAIHAAPPPRIAPAIHGQEVARLAPGATTPTSADDRDSGSASSSVSATAKGKAVPVAGRGGAACRPPGGDPLPGPGRPPPGGLPVPGVTSSPGQLQRCRPRPLRSPAEVNWDLHLVCALVPQRQLTAHPQASSSNPARQSATQSTSRRSTGGRQSASRQHGVPVQHRRDPRHHRDGPDRRQLILVLTLGQPESYQHAVSRPGDVRRLGVILVEQSVVETRCQ
jgi:hypothetical protein